MATPLFSVGGLASGLDTTTIIGQLMQLERQPVVRFQQRQAELRKIDDAWGTVTTKLSSLRGVLDTLAKPGAVSGMFKATSSRSDAVGVAVGGSGTAVAGSTSLTVEQLAQAHQVQAGGSFSAATALVGAGTFQVMAADGTTELAKVTTTASTTLEQLAAQVNAGNTGVSAQVLKVAEGDHRLVITSKKTGTANAFSVASAPPAVVGSTVRTQAVNSRVRIAGLAVERSSNVIDDLVAGTTLTLHQVNSTAVTIDVAQDVDGAVGKVKALVDALNGALSTLKDLTKYDPTSKKSGALQGDSTARQIVADLRNAFGAQLAEGTPAALGISFDRHGVAKLDETVLRAALKDAPAVQRVLDRAVTTTSGLRLVSAPANLAGGAHAVAVTALATAAMGTGTAYRSSGSNQTITITTGGRQIDVAVSANSTLAQAITAINTTLGNAGVSTLAASDAGGAIRLTESRVGSAHGFSVSATTTRFGLSGSFAGSDAQGTIAGVAATGSGNTLTGANGLVVQALAVTTGSVTVTHGLTGAVGAALHPYEGSDSFVGRARSTLTGEIRRLDKRIEDFGVRLDQREKTLRMKFSALETALARSSSQRSWLAGQFGGGQG